MIAIVVSVYISILCIISLVATRKQGSTKLSAWLFIVAILSVLAGILCYPLAELWYAEIQYETNLILNRGIDI